MQEYIQETVQYNNLRSISIVIPAYNEENRIRPVLEEICEYIKLNKMPWNIIVSIDGDDDTEAIVKTMRANNNFLDYIRGNGRGGKGSAIKKAVKLSSGEFTLLMDADGSISLREIVGVIHYLDFYDGIIFDRYSNKNNLIPLYRKIPSRGFNILVRGILGIKVKDTQCGYKLIESRRLRTVFKKISFSNAFFDVAMLYYLKKSGANMKEISVEYEHSNESKFNIFGLILGQGISLLGFRIRNSPLWNYIPNSLVKLYYRKFRWM